MSYFDDIFIVFMKMQKQSCSSYFGGCSLHVCLKKYKHIWDIAFCMTKYCIVLEIMDVTSAKFDVNGPKKIVCFSATLN